MKRQLNDIQIKIFLFTIKNSHLILLFKTVLFQKLELYNPINKLLLYY